MLRNRILEERGREKERERERERESNQFYHRYSYISNI